jgi:hypothetical protein
MAGLDRREFTRQQIDLATVLASPHPWWHRGLILATCLAFEPLVVSLARMVPFPFPSGATRPASAIPTRDAGGDAGLLIERLIQAAVNAGPEPILAMRFRAGLVLQRVPSQQAILRPAQEVGIVSSWANGRPAGTTRRGSRDKPAGSGQRPAARQLGAQSILRRVKANPASSASMQICRGTLPAPRLPRPALSAP